MRKPRSPSALVARLLLTWLEDRTVPTTGLSLGLVNGVAGFNPAGAGPFTVTVGAGWTVFFQPL